jgi:hypothetical protein
MPAMVESVHFERSGRKRSMSSSAQTTAERTI